jgi:hypothetical protein
LASFVEFVDISLIHRRKKALIDEMSLVWAPSEIIKLESVSELRMLHNHDHVFNSDTEFAIFVETRLVRDTHANLELYLGASINTLGSFVHTVERANSVAGAVPIISTSFPEMSSC